MSIPTDNMPDGHVKTIILMSREMDGLRDEVTRLQERVNEARQAILILIAESPTRKAANEVGYAWLAANPEQPAPLSDAERERIGRGLSGGNMADEIVDEDRGEHE